MKKVYAVIGIALVFVAIGYLALTAFNHSTAKALTTQDKGAVIVQLVNARLAGKAQVARAKCVPSTQFPDGTACLLALSDGECVGVTAVVKPNTAPNVVDARALPASYCR